MADPHAEFEIAPGITYMDAATFGLPPRATTAAMHEAIDAWAAGTADWIEDWDRPAERTRTDFAALVGVPESTVALLPAVSVGVGWVAATLGDRTRVADGSYIRLCGPLPACCYRRGRTGSVLRSITRPP